MLMNFNLITEYVSGKYVVIINTLAIVHNLPGDLEAEVKSYVDSRIKKPNIEHT